MIVKYELTLFRRGFCAPPPPPTPTEVTLDAYECVFLCARARVCVFACACPRANFSLNLALDDYPTKQCDSGGTESLMPGANPSRIKMCSSPRGGLRLKIDWFSYCLIRE